MGSPRHVPTTAHCGTAGRRESGCQGEIPVQTQEIKCTRFHPRTAETQRPTVLTPAASSWAGTPGSQTDAVLSPIPLPPSISVSPRRSKYTFKTRTSTYAERCRSKGASSHPLPGHAWLVSRLQSICRGDVSKPQETARWGAWPGKAAGDCAAQQPPCGTQASASTSAHPETCVGTERVPGLVTRFPHVSASHHGLLPQNPVARGSLQSSETLLASAWRRRSPRTAPMDIFFLPHATAKSNVPARSAATAVRSAAGLGRVRRSAG